MAVACIWSAYVHGGMQAPGPVGLVFKAVVALRWTWTSIDIFQRPGRCDLPLVGGPDAW